MKLKFDNLLWHKVLKDLDLSKISREITEVDDKIFKTITSSCLNSMEKELIINPFKIYSNEESVLAIHWHPEHIPLELAKIRIENSYPNRKNDLIIPTQHNVFMDYGKYSGIEIDCYSREYATKVQLLVHMNTRYLKNADKLLSMASHTFNYRSAQLFQLLDALTEKKHEAILQEAAYTASVNEDLIKFIRIYSNKIRNLILKYESAISPLILKNRLIRDFFIELYQYYDNSLIDRIQIFLKEVKDLVKKDFNPEFFYETHEMIDEVRYNNGCIIVPHPEQFWPILLADYDVDGYEIWNPQSQQYTEFIITVIERMNENRNKNRLLITMGDDCHLGEKLKTESRRDKAKANREIGYQPGWSNIAIRQSLIKYNIRKEDIINEYKSRLQ